MDSALTTVGLPLALAIIMFGLGLDLTIGDFKRVGRAPKAVAVALGCQIVLLPAIRPDVALFHAPMADRYGNVWVGRQRDLTTLAHASRRTVVTVERIADGNLLDDPVMAAGVLPGFYVEAIAVVENGAWPLSLPGVVAGTLLTFIPASGDFINARLLGNTQTSMIGSVIDTLFLRVLDYPLAAALSFILLVVIALTALAFWRVRRLAGALLLPYLAWVAYATALTASVWRRNPDLL